MDLGVVPAGSSAWEAGLKQFGTLCTRLSLPVQVTVAPEKPLRVKYQFRNSHFRDKISFVSAQN